MTPPTGQGGPGRGQGRHKRSVPREAITVRLEPQDAAKLRGLCKARGVSQAEWVTGKVRSSRLVEGLIMTKKPSEALRKSLKKP